jgi:hypothetical protein
MTGEQVDKTVEQRDRMEKQLLLLTDAVGELMHIVSECPTCKRRYDDWLQQKRDELKNK